MMVTKLVKTVADGDGILRIAGERDTVDDAYLSKGWVVAGVLRGQTPDEVFFVVRHDQIAASAEIVEQAEAIDTSALKDFA